jgi:hypothetical protein
MHYKNIEPFDVSENPTVKMETHEDGADERRNASEY